MRKQQDSGTEMLETLVERSYLQQY